MICTMILATKTHPHFVDIFTVKRRLRDYRREMDHRTTVNIEPGLRGRSGRVVVTAIVM